MFATLKTRINRIAPELQFWGYEGGNVLAAVAGAGGFAAFYTGLVSVDDLPGRTWTDDIALSFSAFPDIVVTVGLAVIVLLTIALSPLVGKKNRQAKSWIDGGASILGLILIGTALFFGANWITFAAVCFVSGSALLRLCRLSPVYLKLGGLMLAAGGVALAAYGIGSLQSYDSVILSVLTCLTGVFVTFASLLTYQGGILECDSHQRSNNSDSARTDPFHPDNLIGQTLKNRLDRPVTALVNYIALPSVFWVSGKTKANSPLLTSMWTRLPWRVLTAVAAVATGTVVGALFGIANMLWALGDVAIGALDWDTDQPDLDSEVINDASPRKFAPAKN